MHPDYPRENNPALIQVKRMNFYDFYSSEAPEQLKSLFSDSL